MPIEIQVIWTEYLHGMIKEAMQSIHYITRAVLLTGIYSEVYHSVLVPSWLLHLRWDISNIIE